MMRLKQEYNVTGFQDRDLGFDCIITDATIICQGSIVQQLAHSSGAKTQKPDEKIKIMDILQ